MRVVQMAKGCEIKSGDRVVGNFEEEKFYIMSDAFHEQLTMITENLFGLEIPFREVYRGYNGEDLNNKKVIMLRHGGGGDILFMTTGIKELKRRYPEAHFSIAVGQQYLGLVKNEPEIEAIYDLPLLLDVWNNFHYHLIFEGIIENNPEASRVNAYDLFMDKMHLDLTGVPAEHKIPTIHIALADRTKFFPSMKDYNLERTQVGIQVEASSPIRNYPPANYIEISRGLIERGCDIFLFGSGQQTLIIESLVKKLGSPHVFPKICESITEAIVVASYMDYFIAPDSLFIHIAGAFQIPVIGIYGPFHSELRMKYFKNAIGIDLETGCSPCFQHGHSPCLRGSPSPCFSLVKPEIVLMAFDKLRIEVKGERNEQKS